MRKVPTSFTLDQHLIDWLRDASERRGTNMSKLVRDLIVREMAVTDLKEEK